MRLSKQKQLRDECNALRRMLLFLKDENVLLKNRFSEIIKESFEKNLLEEAENFHNALIREDERIHLLRNDLAGVDSLLAKTIGRENNASVELSARLHELRNNIKIAEDQFTKLQTGFTKYFYQKM